MTATKHEHAPVPHSRVEDHHESSGEQYRRELAVAGRAPGGEVDISELEVQYPVSFPSKCVTHGLRIVRTGAIMSESQLFFLALYGVQGYAQKLLIGQPGVQSALAPNRQQGDELSELAGELRGIDLRAYGMAPHTGYPTTPGAVGAGGAVQMAPVPAGAPNWLTLLPQVISLINLIMGIVRPLA